MPKHKFKVWRGDANGGIFKNYEVDVEEDRSVYVKMTLTTPMCPVAETLPPEVEAKARGVRGVIDVHLDLVWDPPWHPGMMSEAARRPVMRTIAAAATSSVRIPVSRRSKISIPSELYIGGSTVAREESSETA